MLAINEKRKQVAFTPGTANVTQYKIGVTRDIWREKAIKRNITNIQTYWHADCNGLCHKPAVLQDCTSIDTTRIANIMNKVR